jgi:EpsI family protein
MIASRRDLLVAGAFGATALASGLASFRGKDSLLAAPVDELIPARIGEWTDAPSANILIPRGDTEEMEIYDQLLTRVYTNPASAPVMLLVAYGSGQAGTTQLHRPEICYPAAGFALQGRGTLQLPLSAGEAIRAPTLTATAPGRVEQILYWSRVGRDFPTDMAEQRWSLLRHTTVGQVPDGALVRMSMIAPDFRTAMPKLLAFARALLDLPASTRKLLTGLA